MSFPFCHWTSSDDNIRTLKDIISCSKLPKSSPTSLKLGVKHEPLLQIETEKIIPDELHLLLRVTDILLRNIIFHAVELDNATRVHMHKHKKKESATFLSKLELCVNDCGIKFKVWQQTNESGQETGKYEFTSLRGHEKKKLLTMLPSKFGQFLGSDYCKVANLWKVHMYM